MYDELDELKSLLNGFKDSDLHQLGLQARDYFLRHFDEKSFYRGIADIIEAELNRRQ